MGLLRKTIRKALFTIIDNPPLEFDDKTKAHEAKLKSGMEQLKLLEKPAPNAHSQWEANLHELMENVISKPLNDFLRWDVITHTMFATNSSYVVKEFFQLKKSKDWKSKWKPLLRESPIGHPIPFAMAPYTSGNKVHQAYTLSKIEESLGIEFPVLNKIVEFGGGYGLLCKMIMDLGFKGKYTIYDLPQFSLLQKFYLEANGLNIAENRSPKTPSISCISSFKQLSAILESLEEDENTLFIANWSISEAPISLREKIFDKLQNCQYIFVAYQSGFRDIDNTLFFNELAKEKTEFHWKFHPIPHLGENIYLTGQKKQYQAHGKQ